MSGALTAQEIYNALVELEQKISFLREDEKSYNSPEFFTYIERLEEYEKSWFQFSEEEKSAVVA